MSINLPSDIVMDVMLAADPKSVAVATRRLESGPVSPAVDFATILSKAGEAARASVPLASPSIPGDVNRAIPGRARGKAESAGVSLEALLIGDFISRLLPAASAASLGGGQAAEMWKSVLGEKIGLQIARSGRFGIAKRLFASSPGMLSGETKVS